MSLKNKALRKCLAGLAAVTGIPLGGTRWDASPSQAWADGNWEEGRELKYSHFLLTDIFPSERNSLTWSDVVAAEACCEEMTEAWGVAGPRDSVVRSGQPGGWWHTGAGGVTTHYCRHQTWRGLSPPPGNTGGGGGLYTDQNFTRHNLSCAEARELVVTNMLPLTRNNTVSWGERLTRMEPSQGSKWSLSDGASWTSHRQHWERSAIMSLTSYRQISASFMGSRSEGWQVSQLWK